MKTLFLFILIWFPFISLAQDTSVSIWQTVIDGFTTGDDPAESCLANGYTVQNESNGAEDDFDFLEMRVSPWHNGGLLFGCKAKDSSWKCIKSCFGANGNNPNFLDFKYLTFLAKNENDDLQPGCLPSVSLGKRWPMYNSNVVNIEGEYVQRQSLVSHEWRRVVIPTSAFATAEWPSLDGVKNLWFRSCGTDFGGNQPIYKVTNIDLTDDPPSIGPEIIPIWTSVQDSFAKEDDSKTCMTHNTPYTSTTQDPTGFDTFIAATDKWRSVGLRLGCQGKDSSWQCNHSCFPWNGKNPDFNDFSFYLTFQAKVNGDFTDTCKPSIGFSGGGWPRLNSNKIVLEDGYVDAGNLISDEWRRVVIPLSDFATSDWDLSNMYSVLFHSCGTEHSGAQPTYTIAQMELTDVPPELIEIPPPSIDLATHRKFNNFWYPIFGEGRDDKTWVYASNGMWPSGLFADHQVVVVIPEDESVTFDMYDTTKYDKVIVYGSLIITASTSNILLRPGTLIVETTGIVDMSTDPSKPYTVTIEIDAEIDRNLDPEETTVGVLSLGGTMNVRGNPVMNFMAPLNSTAIGGTSTVTIAGTSVSTEWKIGDDIVLPDTQQGLDVSHWNFPKNIPGGYIDQTEIVTIVGVEVDLDGNTILSLSSPLQYNHNIGAHAGHLTRSVTFVTSPSSLDRGHIMYTGGGAMNFQYVRLEQFGRTTIDKIDNTVMEDVSGLNFVDDLAQMTVMHQGSNQIARYVFHAHLSRVESYLHGSVILFSPRNGCVHHDSRVHTTNNLIVGVAGSGVFLEDGTETGTVINNFLVGNGRGSRGGDDGRFSTSNGKDMGHGGFGIWARGQFATIENNRAEGHFGLAPFAYFIHPKFIEKLKIPDVPGTPSQLVGKTLQDVWRMLKPNSLTIQTFGSFQDNTAYGTWKTGLDLLYFGGNGSLFVGTELVALASSGRQISTTHTSFLQLEGGMIEAVFPDNTIVGVWCNNGGPLSINYEDIPMIDVFQERGGNC